MDANFCKGILQFIEDGRSACEPKCKLNGAKCRRRYGILAGHFGLKGYKIIKVFFLVRKKKYTQPKVYNKHNQTFFQNFSEITTNFMVSSKKIKCPLNMKA